MNFILDRLKVNSTWRGLILVATAIGLKVDPTQADAIAAAGLALVGLINVFRKS